MRKVRYNDDNYVILVKEKIGSDVLLQIVSEQDAKPKAASSKKFNDGKNVWFRMEVEGGKISGHYRTTPTDEWLMLGQCDLPVRGEPKVGLTTAYAPNDVEHFTRFSNFRMVQIQMLPRKP